MYVKQELRSQGIATIILDALENWAEALGYKSCILETGKNNLKPSVYTLKMDIQLYQIMVNIKE